MSKNMRMKKVLSILLCLCMVLSYVPLGVQASDVYRGLNINSGSITITADSWTNGTYSGTKNDGGYLLSDSSSSNNIAIKDAGPVDIVFSDLSISNYQGSGSPLDICGSDPGSQVNLKLWGSSLIQHHQDKENTNAALFMNYKDSLNVLGGGSLTIHGSSNYHGGYHAVQGGNLTVSGLGTTVTLIGGNTIINSYGKAFRGGTITVTDGATVNCYQGALNSTTPGEFEGIGITVGAGSTLNVGKVTYSFPSNPNRLTTSGTVNAGGTITGNVTINGGTVNVNAASGYAFENVPELSSSLNWKVSVNGSPVPHVEKTDEMYTTNAAVKIEVCTTHEIDYTGSLTKVDNTNHKGTCKWCGYSEATEAHTGHYSYSANGNTITARCACGYSLTAELKMKANADLTYTGSAIEPMEMVYPAGWPGATDATIQYTNNTNASTVDNKATATITVEDKTATNSFTITPGTMAVTANGYTGTFDGQAHGITVNAPAGATVKYGTAEGVYGLDASPTRTNIGTTTVYYQVAKDNYNTVTGSATINITAKPLTDDDVTISFAPSSSVYTGENLTPSVTVKWGNETLVAGRDYTLSWSANSIVNPGTYTATVTAVDDGNFSGSKTADFVVGNAALTGVSVSQSGTLTYNGEAQTPTVTETAATVDGQPVTYTYRMRDNESYGSMPAFTNAGTYTVYYKASAPNHNDVEGSFTVTVNKQTVTSPVIASKKYSGENQIADIADTAIFEVTENAGGIDCGSYDVVLTLKDSANYRWAEEIGTIGGENGKNLTLSFAITKAAASFERPYTYSLIYTGENQNLVMPSTITGGQMHYSTDGINWSTDIPQGFSVGRYTVYYKFVGDSNHTDSEIGYVFANIGRIPITVTANDASKTYGDADPALTWTVTTGAYLLVEPLNINCSRTEGENAGTYVITPSQALNANANYDITFVNGTFTINKAPLTIVVENQEIFYGDEMEDVLVNSEDFKFRDDFIGLGQEHVVFTSTYSRYDDAGTYTISTSGWESDNYEISYTPGTLTVKPKPITVTIANKTSVYGKAIAELTATDNGIVNDDTNVYSLATTATKTSDVGKYDIVGTALNNNYSITFENGEDAYEITKAEGLASVSIDGWIYGENEKAPVPFSNTNGVDNVTYLYKVKGAEDTTYTATVPTQAGEYTVKATFAATENYNATTATADFRITKREVTVTAKNATKIYGDINPELTWEVTSGTVLAADPISVDISRANGENVGTYAITVSQSEGANPNYDITFVNGTFTINKAPLTVTAENKTAVYGDLAPQYTVTYSGFRGTDTEEDLRGTLSFACDYAQFSNKGTYTITPSGFESGNYEISYVPGTLTVNPKLFSANEVSIPVVSLPYTGEAQTVAIVVPEGATYELTEGVMTETDAGMYEFTIQFTGNYTGTVTKGWQITRVAPHADAPTAKDLTYTGEAQVLVAAGATHDGTMLYSLKQNGPYLPELPKATAAGTYKVWYTVDGDNNHTDGDIAYIEVTISKAAPGIGAVTADVVNDSLETSAIVLTRENTNVAGNLIVDAGQTLVLGENEIAYTFVPTDSNYKAVTGNVTVTVVDTIAPTGTVTLATNNWTNFLNNITFGLFFKETQTVSVVASDNLSGVAKIEYIESKTAMDLDAVKAATQWTEMDSGSISVTLEDTKQFVYYIRITDKSGNVSYLSSDGAEYDTSVPVIAGVNNGVTYYTSQTVTVTDKNIDTVTLNGEPANVSITLKGDKEATYTIVATDKAGNSTTVIVKMAPIADITESMEGMTSENVTSDDKAALQTIVDAVTELLKDEKLPAEEKEALEKAKADAEALLVVIENADKAADTENTGKVEDVTADNVTPEDKSDLEKAKADLEKALEDNGGNYTAEEKKAIEDELKRIEDALEVIENVETVEDAVSNLPATVEPDDEENVAKIEAAKKAYDALSAYEKSLVSKQTKETLDKLTAAAVAYDIIKGDGSEWKEDSNETLSFTANGAVSKFLGIEINGKTLDPKHYEVKAGSTIVTLKQDYLDTLEAGKYTITFLYTNGETEGTFIVEAVEEGTVPPTTEETVPPTTEETVPPTTEETVPPTTEENKPSTGPATGDDANIMLWTTMLLFSVLAMTVLLVYNKKFVYKAKYLKK